MGMSGLLNVQRPPIRLQRNLIRARMRLLKATTGRCPPVIAPAEAAGIVGGSATWRG